MPITLGCPSCGKRFKARDESAGKKVKCPYCQVAVQVPTAEDAPRGGPGPMSDSAPVPAPGPRSVPPSVLSVPSEEWGALPTGPAPAPPSRLPPPPVDREPFPLMSPPAPPPPTPSRGSRERPKPVRPDPVVPPTRGWDDAPDQSLASGWRAVRRGLFWVQFALLVLTVVGFAGLGKVLYPRLSGNKLPSGNGAEWVSVEGFVNAPGPKAVTLTKEELLDLALYGAPVLLAALFVAYGRLRASGVPRTSGARTQFALSSLFGLVGVAGLFGWFAFGRLQMFDAEKYSYFALVLLLPLAEFWFLTAVAASGVALSRPKAVRAVGRVAFVVALGAFAATLGWELYRENLRTKLPADDLPVYEQGALLFGWLLLTVAYWRAVRHVRVAAREFLDAAAGA